MHLIVFFEFCLSVYILSGHPVPSIMYDIPMLSVSSHGLTSRCRNEIVHRQHTRALQLIHGHGARTYEHVTRYCRMVAVTRCTTASK